MTLLEIFKKAKTPYYEQLLVWMLRSFIKGVGPSWRLSFFSQYETAYKLKGYFQRYVHELDWLLAVTVLLH